MPIPIEKGDNKIMNNVTPEDKIKITVEVKAAEGNSIDPFIARVEGELEKGGCRFPVKNLQNKRLVITGSVALETANSLKHTFFNGDIPKPEYEGMIFSLCY
ncbi:MAG: hypothetical protein WCV41_02055 [Patescibacteria group bacterium]